MYRESRGGRPRLPVPNTVTVRRVIIRSNATLNLNLAVNIRAQELCSGSRGGHPRLLVPNTVTVRRVIIRSNASLNLNLAVNSELRSRM